MSVKFVSLPTDRVERLKAALQANAEGNKVLKMSPSDTSFVGVEDEVTNEEVVNSIKSVPTHY